MREQKKGTTKMKSPHIGKVLLFSIRKNQKSQIWLSEKSGVSQPSISQIISGQVRLTPEALNGLTHCWDDSQTNIRVLIAHLRDEIARSGHDEHAVKFFAGKEFSETEEDTALKIIQRHIHRDPDLAGLIQNIASMLHKLSDTPKPSIFEVKKQKTKK
jgi:lipopolysaccharide biosynthesis regulator YciM